MTPSLSQLKAVAEKNPTPGTTSSGDASPAPHSFNQTNHPNHSPRGTSRYIPQATVALSRFLLGTGFPASPLCTRDLGA